MAHSFRWLYPNGLFYTAGRICEKCARGNMLHAVAKRCYKESYALSGLYAASIAGARHSGLLRGADAIIVPSPSMIGKLVMAGSPRERIFIRPHHIDLPDSDARPSAGDYRSYIGRLSPEKGLRTLLAAFREIPDIPLRIAGSGPLQAEIERSIGSDWRSNELRLEGFVSGEAKERLIASARLIVAPSESYETFGLAVLEAYAAAKPVVASRIGSFRHLVEEGNSGVLVEPGNPKALAKAIRELCSDVSRCLAMGAHGKQLANSIYSPERSLRTLYLRLGALHEWST